MNSNSLAILSVATNKYINYWESMIKSADQVLASSRTEVVAHVLTDQIEKAELIAKKLTKIKVVVHKIEPYIWPEATLYRYRLINDISDSVKSDLVMHLDADMLVMKDFISELPTIFKNDIALVLHPGYFRPRGLGKIPFYLLNRNYIRQDFDKIIGMGKLGDWETSSISRSFVSRKNRRNYVCGGTWFGLRIAFFEMIQELSLLEKTDTTNSIIPKWHDESILNFWLTHNETTLLSPSFCFNPRYPQLKGLPEFIRAVDKNGDEDI